MQGRLTRRDFVAGGAAAGAAAVSARLFGQTPLPSARAPEVLVRRSVRPVVVASANGHRFKNGGDQTCVEKAFTLITEGKDVLDAVVAGVNIVELDPEDTSVGYGGLPNADGVVQLDASVMHGPKRQAGAVGALEGVRTPSLVAKAVMEHTDHHLLVGRDAQAFARRMGFTIEDDLNTERSRKAWLEWKRRTDPEHYPDPAKRQEAAWRALREMIDEGLVDEEHVYGTINCNGVNARGEICGVTTTSGLAWKVPGRLGDSPIFGAGLYVDGAVGAAGSTGRGEANLFNCSSFLIVELMRRGLHPKDAGMEALKRIQAATVEKRLLNARGLPAFNVSFYILNARGEYAGVALYGGERVRFAVCDEKGARLEPLEPLLPGSPRDD
ncbi:MAG TPA: N(4)-(beta-N-acetylglucosaminyl)-L-asparaginase [Vicinamibacterales bacterium]|jgi:N4-(beta-N-acetylglucosaminyl)-L-asparaginase|nr:N(4)-(beta-N-acetylglucosaminyl)-L-asparaginase [Vicinamibacterales bacterium]